MVFGKIIVLQKFKYGKPIILSRDNKMCEICEQICQYIREVFGHTVDPHQLEHLIESSPLSEV